MLRSSILKLAVIASLAAWPLSAVHAQSVANYSNALSNASGLSAHGSGLVVAGSMESVAASGKLTVQAIEHTADGIVLVLKTSGQAAGVSVQVAKQSAAAASLTAGAVIEVVSEAAGYALIHAGQIIAYIPNELGRTMVHQTKR